MPMDDLTLKRQRFATAKFKWRDLHPCDEPLASCVHGGADKAVTDATDVFGERPGGQMRRRRRANPLRGVSRYVTRHVDMYASAHKHGVSKLDVEHAVRHALAAGDQDDGKVLYLGPDRSGNLLRSCRCDETTGPRS